MPLYLDSPIWPWRDRMWSHLISDTSLEELHAAALGLQIPRPAFDGDHYDIPEERLDEVIAYGATVVSSREIVRLLTVSGLRSRKHLRGQSPGRGSVTG